MQPLQDPRINLAELKLHIVKKVGVERSRRYFYYLGRFLNQKVTKSEFDTSCNRLLGKENLALHNKLIRAILRNASLAKSPPPDNKVVGKEDGLDRSGLLFPDRNRNNPVWSNGDLTKVKSGTCGRTSRDMPSRLGANGKVESVLLHQGLCREDGSGNRNTENGDLGPLNSKDKGLEERRRSVLSTSSVTAPLGVRFFSGGTRRAVTTATGADFVNCYDYGGLLDAEMLRKRIENIAVAQGLGGVSAECSSMLNNMLDVYLKKLIKSCVDLTGDRSTNGMRGDKLRSQDGIVNGVRNSLHIQTSNQVSDITPQKHSVSLLDFRVAMEVNPHLLDGDWPFLRERISMNSVEEREEV